MDNLKSEPHIVFWARQIKEHAFILSFGLLRSDLVQTAKQLYEEWKLFEQKGSGDIDQFQELNRRTIDAQEQALSALTACTTNTPNQPNGFIGWISPSFLEHTLRESRYADLAVENSLSLAQHLDFWLSCHIEHTELIKSLLDPSEKVLSEQLEYFIRTARPSTICTSPESIEQLRYTFERSNELTTNLYHQVIENAIRGIIHPLIPLHELREGIRSVATIEMTASNIAPEAPLCVRPGSLATEPPLGRSDVLQCNKKELTKRNIQTQFLV